MKTSTYHNKFSILLKVVLLWFCFFNVNVSTLGLAENKLPTVKADIETLQKQALENNSESQYFLGKYYSKLPQRSLTSNDRENEPDCLKKKWSISTSFPWATKDPRDKYDFSKCRELAGKWFKLAADNGHVFAQFDYAQLLMSQEFDEHDPELAITYLKMAANTGHTKSQTTLGFIYLKGIATNQSFEQAKSWLELATDDKDPVAYKGLAELHANPESPYYAPNIAIYNVKIAIQMGYPSAMLLLSKFYEEGFIIEIDLVEAMKWVIQAIEIGYPKSITRYEELKQKLSNSQLRQAKRKANLSKKANQ